VVSARSEWTTSTTVSRKLGSGRPGLAMRNSDLYGTCACAAAATTSSASSAARQDGVIALLDAEGRDAGFLWQVRGDGPGAPHQLLPEAARMLAEDKVGVCVEHVPQAAVDFLAQLAGPPGDIAHEVARLVGRRLDDVIDDVSLGG